jgi:hypothetical protein
MNTFKELKPLPRAVQALRLQCTLQPTLNFHSYWSMRLALSASFAEIDHDANKCGTHRLAQLQPPHNSAFAGKSRKIVAQHLNLRCGSFLTQIGKTKEKGFVC